VSFLERLIKTILRLPCSLVVESLDFATDVLSRLFVIACVLIDVVAQVNHQIKVFLLDVRIPVEVAGLVVLT
jgi:hypothetical protein